MPHPRAADAPAANLAALVAQLHRENVELAGRLGFYQARIQELEGRLLLTTGPTAEASPAPALAAWHKPRWRLWG
jgi:hypothetical protein